MGIFVFISLLNITLLTFSFKIILKLFYEFFPNNRLIPIILLLMYLSKTLIINSTYIIESSFTIFWISLLTYLIFTNKKIKHLLIKIAIVSILGQSFRFDFGIVTFILFLFYLIKRNRHFKYIFPIIFSSITLLLQILHNYILDLSFPPSSSIIKSFWAVEFGFLNQFKNSINIIFIDNFLSFSFNRINRYAILLIIISYLSFILYQKFKHNKSYLPNHNLFNFSILVVFTYLIFYTRNGALQNWYIQNIHISLSTIFIFISLSLLDYFRIKKIEYLFILSGVLLFLNIYNSIIPLWPNQLMMYKQSQYIDNKDFEKVGSFNSGIIGYFTKNTIIVI